MRKRFLSVFVLCLMLAHLAGFYVYFVVRLGEVRMEMRKKLADLPPSQLDIVIIPQESFRASWLEELEMKWQGKMYDIARVESRGDEVIVYCLHDKDEDDLLSLVSAIVETGQQDNQQAPTTLIEFFGLEYVPTSTAVPEPEALPKKTFVPVASEHFSSIAYDPAFPPPRS